MYRSYVNHVQEKGKILLCLSSFRKLFHSEFNIGIHIPRKDKCQKCEKYKNISDEIKTEADKTEYLNHQKEKNDAKQLFLKDQSDSNVDGLLVGSFDLQKVLSTPHGPNMMYGFSRKYAVYNFTVYESKTQNGLCYIWGEKDGKRGVNEICTHLYNYLQQVDQEGRYRKIRLYCDNCPGQNKNRIILTMFLFFLKTSRCIQEIGITYLVAGHTYMPVDSVHAVIEKYVSKMNVQAPSEWTTLIRNARRHPKPYDVFPVHYGDFLDWKSVASTKKIRSENGCDLKITDIKRAKVLKSDLNAIFIATSYLPDEEFSKFAWPLKKTQFPDRLYVSELSINPNKLKDLLKLCDKLVIKKQYHAEYLSLSSSETVRDELPQSDVEDREF